MNGSRAGDRFARGATPKQRVVRLAAEERPSSELGDGANPAPEGNGVVPGVPRGLAGRAQFGWNDAQRAWLRAAVEAHSQLVWRTLRRFGVEPRAVDDAVQHVFLTLTTQPNPPPPDKQRAFLVGACIRIAANARRARSRSREVLDEIEPAGVERLNPEELLSWKQRRQALDVALDSLSLPQRSVFVLYELEGFSLPEIAESLELPLGTVTSRLRRARQAFEAWVSQNHGGGEE
ncbi:MAG TPA: sigma-70 family RNA polymerase sigma factor [Polyangiaceae bacterium]|jgi:RNA polymerase sigma-70 factor (ECF subfamily)|nr:sigma-70 family RNA polymerase sigma factor [Polyangiaceae bacterium]